MKRIDVLKKFAEELSVEVDEVIFGGPIVMNERIDSELDGNLLRVYVKKESDLKVVDKFITQFVLDNGYLRNNGFGVPVLIGKIGDDVYNLVITSNVREECEATVVGGIRLQTLKEYMCDVVREFEIEKPNYKEVFDTVVKLKGQFTEEEVEEFVNSTEDMLAHLILKELAK